jgi:SAM-dependent methyltransferase
MADFLAPVREHVDAEAPHLRPLFDVMAAEARFARSWLDDDLKCLPSGAAVLEVGGGAFLLSYALASEGFSVTAIEPTGVGFGAFEELGHRVLALAKRDGVEPVVARCKAEEFVSSSRFAFAFSLNVMEHVDVPELAVERVVASLNPGASYRFLCPNYLFPYEPHFNIPIVINKPVTERLFRRRIESNTSNSDPMGLWRSLNWITVPRVRRMATAGVGLRVSFERRTLASVIARAIDDSEFAKRRSAWMVRGIRTLKAMGLLHLAARIPASLQPIMDARVSAR